MGRRIRFLRPEDCEVRLLVRENMVHKDVSQICESAAGKSSSSVKWIRGLPILEPLNGNRSRGITVAIGKRQGARVIGVDSVPRKGIPGLLELLGETQWHRRIFVEDEASSPIILDECSPVLADC